MPSERQFSNIISLTVGSNTALEAVNAIIMQLKTLQGIARETGMALDANVLNKMGGQATPSALTTFAGPGLSQMKTYDPTMGGLAAQGSGGLSVVSMQQQRADFEQQVARERQDLEALRTRVTSPEYAAKSEPVQKAGRAELAFAEQSLAEREQLLAPGAYEARAQKAIESSEQAANAQIGASKRVSAAEKELISEQISDIERVSSARQTAAMEQASAIKMTSGIERGAPGLPPVAAGGLGGVNMGEWVNQNAVFAQTAQQYMAATGASAKEAFAYVNQMTGEMVNLDQATQKSGRSLSGHVGSIITGMLVWQGMNTVMNAVIGTYQTAVDETMRLDQTSARLSVTLGITKEAASQAAMAMSLQGVQYGLAPEQSLGMGQYAARVRKEPAEAQELTKTAAMLGAVTGEDTKKLIDDLNVTARQTGISISVLGDMSAKAFQNSGTSASQYLNILREIGPLAKESGIDIDRMAGIAALAADRMGGSMSDAANTLTRLIKAATDPNAAQLSILNKYQIPIGDVQQAMDMISKANMSAQELATLGGRPGMPAVANDIRTMIAVYKEYDGELQKGQGLQDQFSKSTDNIGDAGKRLKGSWDVLWQSFGTGFTLLIGGVGALDTLTARVIGLSEAIKNGDWGMLFEAFAFGGAGGGILAPGFLKMGQAAMNQQQPAMTGGLPPDMRGQAEAGAISGLPAPKQTMTAMQLMLAQAAEKETGPVDLNKYNQAQITAARADAQRMSDDWLKSLSDFYDSQKIPEDEKEKSMAKAKEMIDSTVAFFEKNGQIISETGAPARYLQEALSKREQETSGLKTTATDVTRYSDEDLKRGFALVPQYVRNLQDMWRQQLANEGRTGPEIARIIGEKMTEMNQYQAAFMRGNSMTMLQGPAAMLLPQILPQLSRTQALEDRLSELRMSLEDLDDTEKKRAQLEGQWNIPTGAKLLVPLTAESQALIKEHGGESEDEAKNRRREQILREIAETERKLAAEKAKDATLLAMLSAQQNASTTANMGLSSTGTAGQQAAIALYALKAAAGDWGSRPGPTAAEQARERVAGATPPSEPPWREPGERKERAPAMAAAPEAVPTGTYLQGMQGQSMNLNSVVTIKAMPMQINNTLTAILDGYAVAQALTKYLTQDLVYEATSSGALTQ